MRTGSAPRLPLTAEPSHKLAISLWSPALRPPLSPTSLLFPWLLSPHLLTGVLLDPSSPPSSPHPSQSKCGSLTFSHSIGAS